MSNTEPFLDVIRSAPTRGVERALSPHPSLKPQAFMRQVVRAVLPLGAGLIHDPFAGGGSTLDAARHLGVPSTGTELDAAYAAAAPASIVRLSSMETAAARR